MLNNNFWRMPEVFRDIMKTKDIKLAVLEHKGRILAKGELWDIKYKSRGLGLYDVWLEKAKI